MAGDSLAVRLCEEKPGTFSKHRRHAYYLWVVLHELFGHGTGKLLQENLSFLMLDPKKSTEKLK